MANTMYVYKNHKITGPDGYAVDIIVSNHGNDITIEGSDNITLKREEGKYIISHNFLEEGTLEKNSVMEYKGARFSVGKEGKKNLKARKIDFTIYSHKGEVAFINKFKQSLNININNKYYIIPVIIYIAVLSRRLKEKFGRLYMKNGLLQIGELMVYSLLGIFFTVTGLGVNSIMLSTLSVLFVAGLPLTSMALSKIRKSSVF